MSFRQRFRQLSRAAISVSGLLLAGAPARALDPDRTLAQLHHTAWTAEDGAPSQISALAQTTDGYLWIGSARGLFRFDGVAFERYVPPDSVSLPSHNIYALLATPDGGLWISFRPSGVGWLKDGRFTSVASPSEISATSVYMFACDQDGRVWAGTHDGLLLRDGSRWVPIGHDWSLPPDRVQSLFVDHSGTLWVAANNGLYWLPRGTRSFQTSNLGLGWIASMSEDREGRLWLAEVHSLTVLRGSGDTPVTKTMRDIKAVQVLVDRDGCLWIAPTRAEGLRRVRFPDRLAGGEGAPGSPQFESIGEADGLSAGGVHVVLEDREGNIWAGTTKGLDRFRHNHLVPIALPDGYQALTLLAGEQDGIVVGSAIGGKSVLRVDENTATAMPVTLQLTSFFHHLDGVTWWGGFNEIVRQEGDAFRTYRLPAPMREWIWEVFRGTEPGAVWASVGDRGLYHVKDGVWEKRSIPGLPDRGPSASYHAPDGRIWLGYTENRVCVLNDAQVRAFTAADGIEIGRVRVIRGRGPQIWVGGELGLSVLKDGRFRTVACAGSEPFGTVTGIVETPDGSLWLNEMRGVVHIPADEVARVLADPQHAAIYRRYDVQEGLPGAGQMNWTCSTAIEARDGKVWFATDGGLAWVHPAEIRNNPLPPPVRIRAIHTEAGAFDPSTAVKLPNRTATLRIDYTALSLTIPERVRFRYRLEGYDEDWHDAGARRSAFYTRLRPGSYRFRVVAANNDGVWNTDGALASFSIEPAFYQTRWFAAACLTAIIGALWLAYQIRVRQVAARLQRLHDERVDERMRIAHELHDTLLQGFLSASMQLHVAMDAIASDSPAKQQVGRVLGLMDKVSGDARNTVRGLRTAADRSPVELAQAFTRIPQEAGGNGKVDFRVVVNGRLRPLQPMVRDEVYRIGRESIVNALRHAGARSIETEMTYLPHELRVVVRDDGCGIDPQVLRAGRDGHWGLSGMRERARRMNSQLSIRSRVGAGTEIELVVPGRIAYADAPPTNLWQRAARWWRARAAAGKPREE